MNYKIIVINLKHRNDRKLNVINSFKKVNIDNYYFFDAIYGKELKLSLEIKNLFNGNDFGNRKGFIGCALSHYEIWLNLLEDTNNDYYIIFEDDIEFSNNFTNNFNYINNVINNNLNIIDFFFLGYHPTCKYDPTNNLEKKSYIIKELDKNKYIGGFFSYVITKNGAKKIIKYIEKNGIKHGIDYLLKIDDNFNSLEIDPHIVYSDWVKVLNDTVDSNIQKDFDVYDFTKIIDNYNYLFIK